MKAVTTCSLTVPAELSLTLFGTVGCHLCEDALVLVLPLLEAAGAELYQIDIADSDELMARYGVTIPVLRRNSDDAELCWPFDGQILTDFIG